jgi:hypothetical protein
MTTELTTGDILLREIIDHPHDRELSDTLLDMARKKVL